MKPYTITSSLAALLATASLSQAVTLWTVGLDDDSWPVAGAGSANAFFAQENGGINALPGSPTSTAVAFGADNDYYLAGIYAAIIPANGSYAPVGIVASDEVAAERAFAGGDLSLRYHFNLPSGYAAGDLLSVTFDALNLDGTAGLPDPRFGVEVYINGNKVMNEVLIRGAQLGTDYTSTPISIGAANVGGVGTDNIVELRGISYNGAGGGNWMGVDYVRLDVTQVPEPASPMGLGALGLGLVGMFRRRR